MPGLAAFDGLDVGFVVAHLGLDELPVVGVAAVVLVAAVVTAGAVMARSGAGSGTRIALRTLVWVAVAGIGFQVIHFVEHLAQAGYWVLHPVEAPWLTPWAVASRDVLASVADGQANTGNELLHLGGNAVFFAGLVAALLAVQASARFARTPSGLRGALWAQGIHVALHLGLTVTWMTIHQAHGLSTLFGLLEPGTVLANAMRVWVHFVINLVATVYAVIGLWQMRAVIPGLPGRRSPREPAATAGEETAVTAGQAAAVTAGEATAGEQLAATDDEATVHAGAPQEEGSHPTGDEADKVAAGLA